MKDLLKAKKSLLRNIQGNLKENNIRQKIKEKSKFYAKVLIEQKIYENKNK